MKRLLTGVLAVGLGGPLAALGACSDDGNLNQATRGPVPVGNSGGTGGGGGSAAAAGGTAGATSGAAGAATGGSGGAGATSGAGASSAAGGSGGAGAAGAGAGGQGADGGGGEGGADPCRDVVCAMPPANVCADANNLLVYSSQGTCDAGICAYPTSTTPCAFGCNNAACTGDPCAGVSCNTPPPSVCKDADNLSVYVTPGTCDQGVCTYSTRDQSCQFGCSAGKCTGDPCAGVSCNTPPASFCSGANDLTVYDAPGSCNAVSGACSYGSHVEYCSFGCLNGACDGDPCVGVTCNTPPASYCVDASTARVFTTPGTCSGGGCNYASTDQPCPLGCVGGVCRQCNTTPDCGGGKLCSSGVCVPCDSDAACGASCQNCAAAGQVCIGGSSCGDPGCPPPVEACSNGSQSRDGCGNARVIGRPQAAAGFSTSSDTCDARDRFDQSSGCWDANADHTYRLYMRAGETALARITKGSACIGGTWYPSLNIYTNSGCGDTSCQARTVCDDNSSGGIEINYTAAYDGWHILVVDGKSAFDDEGDYTFTVQLTCNRSGCEC